MLPYYFKEPDIEIIVSDEPTHEKQTEPINEDETILLIGNSKTYYNNLPQMFKEIIELNGKNADVYCISWGGERLSNHASRVKLTIKSHGNFSELDASEKRIFGSDEIQAEKRFTEYANALLDTEGKKRVFTTLIFQELYSSLVSTTKDTIESSGYYSACADLIDSLACENTKIILNSVWPTIHIRSTYAQTLEELLSQQNIIDANSNAVLNRLSEDNKQFKASVSAVAYSGRAFVNYLLYYGPDFAYEIEPDLFSYIDGQIRMNDLYLIDGIHPTQLGSLIESYSLYMAVYNSGCQEAMYNAELPIIMDSEGKSHVACAVNFSGPINGNNVCIRAAEDGSEYSYSIINQNLIELAEKSAREACIEKKILLEGRIPEILSVSFPVPAAIGENIYFSVSADGIKPEYQWECSKDGGETWYDCNYTGASTEEMTMTLADRYTSRLYRCRVSDLFATVYSDTFSPVIIVQ